MNQSDADFTGINVEDGYVEDIPDLDFEGEPEPDEAVEPEVVEFITVEQLKNVLRLYRQGGAMFSGYPDIWKEDPSLTHELAIRLHPKVNSIPWLAQGLSVADEESVYILLFHYAFTPLILTIVRKREERKKRIEEEEQSGQQYTTNTNSTSPTGPVVHYP